MTTEFETDFLQNQNYTLFARNIAAAKGKEVFACDSAMFCLSKSPVFFKELSNTFNTLWYQNITPQVFSASIENCNLFQTDKKRLVLCAKLYQSYIETLQQNSYKIPFPASFINTNNKSVIPEIQKCLDILDRVFVQKTKPEIVSQKTDCIKYLEFSDIQSESEYVISKIKELVDTGKYSYGDIAVFADKSEARQKFLDMMKSRQIPVESSIYNENYENLKHKINIYKEISDLCLQLKFETFSSDAFKTLHENAAANSLSRSQKEICLENLDEIIKNLLEEILPDGYTLDKLVSKKENSQKSLPEILYSQWNSLSEDETNAVSEEFGLVKTFYSGYSTGDYAAAIESVIKRYLKYFENTNLAKIAAGKIKSLKELQSLYSSVLKSPPDFEAFNEILQWLPKDETKDKNAIKLASISANLKPDENFKIIFICGLTENNFPGTNSSYPFISQHANEVLSSELKKTNSSFDSFLTTDEQFFEQKYKSFCSVISHTVESIIFTTHIYEAKKSSLPSVFFKALSQNDSLNFEKINDAELKNQNNSAAPLQEQKPAEERIVKDTDKLRLNPSAISTFQQCPKKYFYKNLLNLKEKSTFSASYGSIVHAVFEVLNKRFCASDMYNKSTAFSLCEILFGSKNNEENALKAGFKQSDIELVKAADDLSLKEMKENFKNAIEDYDMTGYFDNIPQKAICETSFSFSVDELPNIVFDGRIDAILTEKDGNCLVVDYKTGKDKTNTLDYAISDNGVNFRTKSGKDSSNPEALQKSYDYQIPIYYLACKNSENLKEYKDTVNELGLVYIRPKSKHNGCKEDFISTERLDSYKDKIIQNLKETVIDKIVNEKEFKGTKNWNCDSCSFNFLCDGGDDDE